MSTECKSWATCTKCVLEKLSPVAPPTLTVTDGCEHYALRGGNGTAVAKAAERREATEIHGTVENSQPRMETPA